MTSFDADFGAVPAFVPQADAAGGVVATDVPCRKCQYNLRGLPVEGRCPECGTPVGYSTRGDLLRYSEPDWVNTLRQGVTLILWGILAAILGGIAGAVLRGVGVGPISTLLLGMGAGLLSVVGSWLLTTPDPSGVGEDRYGTSRKVIRVTLVVGLGQQLVALAQQTGAWPPAANLLLSLVGGAAALVGLVGTFATLNYLSKLALRIPDAALADRARSVMYGYGIPLGVMAVFGVIAAVAFRTAGGRPGGGFLALGCVIGICGLVMLVFGIMYIFMLLKFSTRLREQAALARSTWASTPATAAAAAPPLAVPPVNP